MTKVRNFCTLHDYRYLTRGLALYESLRKNMTQFQLFVYCIDNDTYEILRFLERPNLIPIRFSEMENERLLSVKAKRSFAEYCWTATPFTVLHALETYSLIECTYLDADTYFFNDPTVLFDELGSNSVGITPHWYSPAYDQSKLRGKYCVQFNYFKNDKDGLRVLNWWADRCIEWCSAIPEDGKFGDQKYLDQWVDKFPGVHEFSYRGGGVAPWNIQQYEVANKKTLEMYHKKKHEKFNLIYYHFHALDYLSTEKVSLGGYQISLVQIKGIYGPYICHLEHIKDLLKERSENFKKSQKYKTNLGTKIKRLIIDPSLIIRYVLKRYHMNKNILYISDLDCRKRNLED